MILSKKKKKENLILALLYLASQQISQHNKDIPLSLLDEMILKFQEKCPQYPKFSYSSKPLYSQEVQAMLENLMFWNYLYLYRTRASDDLPRIYLSLTITGEIEGKKRYDLLKDHEKRYLEEIVNSQLKQIENDIHA